MWVLLGVAVLVLGFVLRLNPLLVIVISALTTGLTAAMAPGVGAAELWAAAIGTLEAFGKAFNDSRYFHITWLILPLIGLLEREGLQERARMVIGKAKAATAGRLLVIYLFLRQATSAAGLTSLGGHPQMVRPLVAPMAESAAEVEAGGQISDDKRYRIRGMAAATDNIGLFFGEDIFIAIGSIVLMVSFLQQAGIHVEPLELSVWAIPTAIAAFLIHGARLVAFDKQLRRPETLSPDKASDKEAAQ